jgi:hypothetical protein
MIGNALRVEIDRYAVEMRRSNPLYMRAADGTLTADCIATYLANIHHLICYTPTYLTRARDRAAALGDAKLTAHYQHKRGEEVGHEAWAERDLQRVAPQAIRPVERNAVPSMHALIDYLARLIDHDPALYLSYILFAEHLLVVLGPEWLEMLETRCGIPRSSMTVIGNHIELDKEHVEEALEQIDILVGDPRKLPDMRRALRATMAHFDQFCVEVTAAEDEDDAVLHDASKHVSAA